MEGSAIIAIIITALVSMMWWRPTRLLILWAISLTIIISIALAVGPMWFIAILLVLLILK